MKNKNLLIFAFSLLSAYFLVPILLSWAAFLYYEKNFTHHVRSSINQLVDNGNYCIIGPHFVKNAKFWGTFKTPEDLPLYDMLEQTIKYKLLIYNQYVGSGLKDRGMIGREPHFGILTTDKFYYWSFTKNTLVFSGSYSLKYWVGILNENGKSVMEAKKYPNKNKALLNLKDNNNDIFKCDI